MKCLTIISVNRFAAEHTGHQISIAQTTIRHENRLHISARKGTVRRVGSLESENDRYYSVIRMVRGEERFPLSFHFDIFSVTYATHHPGKAGASWLPE